MTALVRGIHSVGTAFLWVLTVLRHRRLRLRRTLFCATVVSAFGGYYSAPQGHPPPADIIPFAFAQPLSSRIANYSMKVRLNPRSHSIDGTEVLNWHNTSDQNVSELYFHLYANAFKSNQTTFMRESGRKISSSARGRIDILNMTDLRTQDDLAGNIKFVQLNDGNPHDSTVIVVQLTKPVAPRDSIELKIRFHEQLPQAISRSGWAPGREFYFVAQWFPKIGVYEDGRWNCHQFHAFTGFFADFGVYDVKINVPVQYVVGATGKRVGEEMNPNGTMTYHYVADDVHDFAWTASPDFLTRTRTFPDFSQDPDHGRDKYPGLPETKIILLLQPEHRDQEERYFAAVDTAMKYFELWYGAYPYPDLTVVDPPRTAAVGAEYPTLITARTEDYTLKHFLSPEVVTIREFGHQYWYGMVASNGFEEAWLDEGLNSYSTGKVLEKAYGANTSVFRVGEVYPVYLYPIWSIAGVPVAAIIGKVWIREPYNRLPLYLKYAKTDAISEFGCKAFDYGAYRAIAYNKPELVLRTLEGLLGSDVMEKVMRTYFEEYKFKHPTAKDFQNVCEQVSGRNLDWFFNQFIYGTGVVDFAVKSISYYRETDLNTGASTYLTKVVVMRNGEVKMPVDLQLSLEDGSAVDTVWDGQNRPQDLDESSMTLRVDLRSRRESLTLYEAVGRPIGSHLYETVGRPSDWQVFEFRTGSAPEYAVLDPSNKIPLDVNYSNNSLLIKSFFSPVVKWVHRIFNYFQNMLLNVGVLA